MYKLIAHRGEKKSSKENSMAAFFDAINSDYVGFECDIRTTKDGKFAVYHDALFHGKLVKNLNYEDLKKEQIILLEDVLEIQTDKIIMIDIKDPFLDADKLMSVLKFYADKKIYVMSFYDNVIRKLFVPKRKYQVGILNYILNTEENHFKYDFLCLLDAVSSDKIIRKFQVKNKKLFIYGVKRENIKDKYPYYIVD